MLSEKNGNCWQEIAVPAFLAIHIMPGENIDMASASLLGLLLVKHDDDGKQPFFFLSHLPRKLCTENKALCGNGAVGLNVNNFASLLFSLQTRQLIRDGKKERQMGENKRDRRLD